MKGIVEELFYYDETSPSCLRWAVDRYSGRYRAIKECSTGDVAGSLGSSGYYSVRVNKKLTLVHRIILELHDINLDGLLADHIDGCKTNNKINNLRAVTKEINARNCKIRVDNKSGTTGVKSYSVQRGYGVITGWRVHWEELSGKAGSKT